MTQKLTGKQRAFVDAYLIHFNATRAALVAGYSPTSARQQGSENLSKPYIVEAISTRFDELAMGANEVLKRLADMGRGDIGEFLSNEGPGFDLDLKAARDAGQTKLIKRIRQKTTIYMGKGESDEDREVHDLEIELYDAQAALEKLGKYHKLFAERLDVQVREVQWDGLEEMARKIYGKQDQG